MFISQKSIYERKKSETIDSIDSAIDSLRTLA